MQHPWLTLIRPVCEAPIGRVKVQVYGLGYTSLPRLRGDLLMLACDQTLRMVSGVRKMVRDGAGENLIEEEAVRYAPLAPGEAVVTAAGRMRMSRVVHFNIFEANGTTHATLQAQALDAAFKCASELGARRVVIADYTSLLRRGLVEEVAWAIFEAIKRNQRAIREVWIVCFQAVHRWVFHQLLEHVTEVGWVPYPFSRRVRSTMLYVVQQRQLLRVPAEAILHVTDTDLRFDLLHSPSELPIGWLLKKRGGRELVEATRRLAPLRLGEATFTPGGRLPYRWVIHLATRSETQPCESETLRSALQAALALADSQKTRTLLVPNPAKGYQDITPETAAQVAVETLLDYLYRQHSDLERILLIAEQDEEESLWWKALQNLREPLRMPVQVGSSC